MGDVVDMPEPGIRCGGYTGRSDACDAPQDPEHPGEGMYIEGGAARFICTSCWIVECGMAPADSAHRPS